MADEIYNRYEVQFGRIRVYKATKESEKFFTYMETWDGKDRIARRMKQGTFLTAREAVEDSTATLNREIELLTVKLREKQDTRNAYRAVLDDTPDERLIEEFNKIKRW